MPQATLTQTDPSGKLTLLTVALENARITSYQVGGNATSPLPGETVSLSFTKITVSYIAGGAKTSFGWDLKADRPTP